MKRYIIICCVALMLPLLSCKTNAVASNDTPSNDPVKKSGSSSAAAARAKERSVVVGEPQKNTAVAAIFAAEVGGDEGAYIATKMDSLALQLGKTKLSGAKILRIGEGIKITMDGSPAFERGTVELSTSAQKTLTKIANTIAGQSGDIQVIIESHTDGTGSADKNMVESKNQANAIAAFLGENKVDRTKIVVRGYGEEQPLFSNGTAAGRKQNSRIEIIIIANETLRAAAKNKS